MKPEFIQPIEGVFTFEESDRMIAFAESNNMTVIGHTLIWHHMTPKWFFQDKEGNPVKREILIERLRKITQNLYPWTLSIFLYGR